VKLLDLADVDIVREVRIPEFSRNLDSSQRNDLAETLSLGIMIQSGYGLSTSQRQLFEPRKNKRESAITPTVDADDPVGELIGSFVVVGNGVDTFADRLRRHISSEPICEDAPEFTVPIPIEVADQRHHYAQVVKRMCRHKSIRTTREAISMLAAFTGSPYDAARALYNLQRESKAPGRDIRLDEVRFALTSLDPEHILPMIGKNSLSKAVHALLAADEPLSQTSLADRADVSTRSIRNHLERLAAFDFIRKTDDGWRFALPFQTNNEPNDTPLPYYVATNKEHQKKVFVRDVLWKVVCKSIDASRYSDPNDPIGSAFYADPKKVIPELCEATEWIKPWVDMIRMLLDEEPSKRSECIEISHIGFTPEYRP